MKVTVFLDGRAGHEKQSLAIAQALQELADAEISRVRLEPMGIFGRVAGLCRLVLARGCAGCPDDSELLLGTGSGTHLALLGCKKKLNVPAVTCMAPEPYLRPWFDLCCVPRHDGLPERGNVFLTEGPPVLSGPVLPRDSGAGLILIGGTDVRSHVWNGEEIAGFVRAIAERQAEIQWKVSSSPRTPAATVELLKELGRTMANIAFHHFRETPRGWVEEQYAQASHVWVTADSVSMMYEAVTAGCKVGILPVRWKNSRNKFQKSIDYLAQRGLVKVYAGDSGVLRELSHGVDFNEARRCAREILRRFF